MNVQQDKSLYAQCNFCLQKEQDVVSFNGDGFSYTASICEECMNELHDKGGIIFNSLKPKSEDKRTIPTEREHLQCRLSQLTEAMNESIKNGKTIFLDWPIEINEIIMKLGEE